jgi:phosphopantothenoylcysteine synthetase/decarboxylase
MNFEKLNARLTFVANIGVVIGLIFLVVELRQSNDQAAAATEQDRSNTVDVQFREYATSDYLPEIYAKMAESGVDSLSSVELLRARAWENARVARMTGQVSQYYQGYLDEEIY